MLRRRRIFVRIARWLEDHKAFHSCGNNFWGLSGFYRCVFFFCCVRWNTIRHTRYTHTSAPHTVVKSKYDHAQTCGCGAAVLMSCLILIIIFWFIGDIKFNGNAICVYVCVRAICSCLIQFEYIYIFKLMIENELYSVLWLKQILERIFSEYRKRAQYAE